MECPLRQAALDTPNLTALKDRHQSFTFKELDELVNTIRFDSPRCILIEPPSISAILKLFAALRQNIPFCPLNLRLPSIQIEKQIQQLAQAPFAQVLLFTSGSTATPKLARLSLSHFLSNARALIPTVNLAPEDGWLLSLPLYHVGGLSIVFRCILARAQIILNPTDLNITHISNVPTQLYRSWPIHPKLKCILLGGAPIYATEPMLPIIVTYGLTEMSSAVLAQKPKWKNGRLYFGHPLPGHEIKLENREIFVRGASLFHGYANEKNQPFTKTPKTHLQDQWFATKDLASFDAELGYSIIGRKDNLFISGGENIQPEEIEQILLENPDVLEAVVVPKSDPQFGTRPVAFLRTVHSINEKHLQITLQQYLPKYKIPIEFHPLEQTGFKADRKVLINSLLKI